MISQQQFLAFLRTEKCFDWHNWSCYWKSPKLTTFLFAQSTDLGSMIFLLPTLSLLLLGIEIVILQISLLFGWPGLHSNSCPTHQRGNDSPAGVGGFNMI